MPAGKPWSPADRARALELLRAGHGPREVERQTGISRNVVSGWAKDAGIVNDRAAQTEAASNATALKWAQRRDALVDDLGEVAALLVTKARTASARDAQSFMTAAAIGVDKAQLLSGAATSRHEQMTADRARERIAAMADELAERRAAKDTATG